MPSISLAFLFSSYDNNISERKKIRSNITILSLSDVLGFQQHLQNVSRRPLLRLCTNFEKVSNFESWVEMKEEYLSKSHNEPHSLIKAIESNC